MVLVEAMLLSCCSKSMGQSMSFSRIHPREGCPAPVVRSLLALAEMPLGSEPLALKCLGGIILDLFFVRCRPLCFSPLSSH